MRKIEQRCGNCKFYQPGKSKLRGTCGQMVANTLMCFGDADKKDSEVGATFICAMWEPVA